MGSVNIEGIGELSVPDEFFDMPPQQQQRVVDSLIAEAEKPTDDAMSERSMSEQSSDAAGALLTGFNNQWTAAGQKTTPVMEAQEPNLVSDEVFEDELGNLNYRDPQTGELVPTDSATQVVLRDPTDQRIKIYERTPETDESMASSTGRILGTGVLGMPGGVAARSGMRAPQAAAASVPLQPANEVAAAAGRIAPSLPRGSAGGPIQQSAAAKLAELPVVGRPLEKAGQAAVDEMGQAARTAAEGYGSGNVAKAGAAAREGVESYITTLSKQRVDRLYDRVDELIDPNATAKIPATANAVSKIGLSRLAAKLPPSKASDAVRKALDAPEGLTYQGMKTLRTSIGEMLDTGLLPADMQGSELKQLYKALTIDLRNAAKAAGGEQAASAWDKATRTAKLVAERRENLARIVGAKNDEGIVSNVQAYASTSSRGDLKLLRQARKAAGSEAWDEISSAIIERLGVGRNGQFSPLTFATAWNKRLTPEGKRVLFRSTDKPQLAAILDDLATLSTAAQEAQQYVNTSKTGPFLAATGFVSLLYAAPLTALSTALTGHVLARYLARPVAAKAILDWSKAFNRANKLSKIGPARSAQNFYLQASKALSEALAREAGASELAPRIFSELQREGPEEQSAIEQESDFHRFYIRGGVEENANAGQPHY